MIPTDDYVLATPMTRSTIHIVGKHDGPASMLIMGSDDYEVGVHRRGLCGTVTKYTNTEPSDDPAEYCWGCVRTGWARGMIDDPAPFEPADLEDGSRKPMAGGGDE